MHLICCYIEMSLITQLFIRKDFKTFRYKCRISVTSYQQSQLPISVSNGDIFQKNSLTLKY